MLGWRAWYAGGRTFNSAKTSWQDLPAQEMLGVVVYLEDGYREILQSCDWWYKDARGVHGVLGLRGGEWAPRPDAGLRMVKQGIEVSDEEWERVQTEMMESRQWP